MRKPQTQCDACRDFEAFLGEVDGWAETIEVLLKHLAPEDVPALNAYVDQMRTRIRILQGAGSPGERRRDE